jgi:hypothetical protein
MTQPASADAVPAFTIGGTRYDLDTQWGRFQHFMNIADPRCLAPSVFFGMSLPEATKLIDNFKADKEHTRSVPDAALWTAQKIHSAAVHPDTGEVIPQPLRMSGFAVYGAFIVSGMLLPNPLGNVGQASVLALAHLALQLPPCAIQHVQLHVLISTD